MANNLTAALRRTYDLHGLATQGISWQEFAHNPYRYLRLIGSGEAGMVPVPVSQEVENRRKNGN
ncbi:MAG: hypothetical protein M0O99_03115 [Desulfuromonas thiophila]|jgi:hypothetical protein|nr:hypothetical protein [Desulfuromonas thiophila]MDY0251347.1 hypothetical protein [Pseudomonas sp.]